MVTVGDKHKTLLKKTPVKLHSGPIKDCVDKKIKTIGHTGCPIFNVYYFSNYFI